MTHKFSFWPRVTGPLEVKERTWDQILATFSLPRVTLPESLIGAPKSAMQAAKRDNIPAWSPSLFNGSRSLANFIEANAIGLDFDGDSPCIDDLALAFGRAAGFIHSTVSHTPEAPRSRVVLPLSRPVNEPEYRALWTWASSLAPGVDGNACDPARLWYVPAVIAGCEYRFEVLSGAPIDVDHTLWTIAPLSRIQTSRSPVEVGAGHGGAGGDSFTCNRDPAPLDEVENARAYARSCEISIQGSNGWQNAFKQAAKIVRGFELTNEQAFDALREWNARCQPPWPDHELRRIVRHAADKSTIPWGCIKERRRGRAA